MDVARRGLKKALNLIGFDALENTEDAIREALGPMADALSLIHDLQAENAKLREMLEWCAEESRECLDIDGGDFQNAMESRGFFVEVPADEDFKAEWDTDKMYVVSWSPLAGEQE